MKKTKNQMHLIYKKIENLTVYIFHTIILFILSHKMNKQKASDKIKQMEAQKRHMKYNNHQYHTNTQHNFYILSNNYYNSDNNFTTHTTHTTHTTSESNQPFNTFDNVFK